MPNALRNKLTRPSVEFNLTEHCNLSCYACDHASPLLPEKFASVESFSRDFEALSAVFHSDQIRLVGGEPLLHPQLLDFLTEARRIGIADAIVVYTNGLLLHKVPERFWDLVDQLWVSVYPGVKIGRSVEECTQLSQAHNVRLHVDYVEQFERTVMNDRIEDPDLVQIIFRECRLAGEYSCHTVHEGRFYKCSIAPFMGPRLALRGITFENRATDGVALNDNDHLYEDLDQCLNGPTPLAACSYCLGSSAPPIAHHQLNLRGRAEWLAEDNRPQIEAVRAQLLGPRS